MYLFLKKFETANIDWKLWLIYKTKILARSVKFGNFCDHNFSRQNSCKYLLFSQLKWRNHQAHWSSQACIRMTTCSRKYWTIQALSILLKLSLVIWMLNILKFVDSLINLPNGFWMVQCSKIQCSGWRDSEVFP